jgi:DNA repair protein RadC
VYQGSVHTVQVRYGELFRDAIKTDATSMIVVHNHPSGDPTPSAADIAMTKALLEVGKLLDIDVNDHMIIGGGRYVSMNAMRVGGFGAPQANGRPSSGR